MNILAENALNPAAIMQSIKGVSEAVGPVATYIVAILIFLIGKWIAKTVSKVCGKGISKTGIDEKLGRLMGSNSGSTEKMLSSLIYGVLLLFVIIFALDFAGLKQVVEPLNDLFKQFLSAIPNLLMAGIVLYLGTVLAKIVKGLVENVLNAARVDERIGSEEGTTPISGSLGTAIYCFIILLFAPVALRSLNMPEISEPIAGISDQILGSVPKILIAGVLIAAGVLIGGIAQKLVSNLLAATGVDNFPGKMGLTIPASGKNSISGLAGTVVFVSIMVLLISTAINALDIELLSKASESILGGFFNVLLAVLIFGAGYVGAKFAFDQLKGKNLTLAKVVQGLIIFFVAVVALNRSGLAPDLTGLPFKAIVLALGFAGGIGGAIALGLGGKDFVARYLDKKG